MAHLCGSFWLRFQIELDSLRFQIALGAQSDRHG